MAQVGRKRLPHGVVSFSTVAHRQKHPWPRGLLTVLPLSSFAASANYLMTKAKLGSHVQRLYHRLRRKKSTTASKTGWDVLASQEDIHSPNAMDQLQDRMVLETSQERIVALTRELGKLREVVAHDRDISDDILTNLLPVTQVHCEGISEAICQFHNIVEQIGRERHGTYALP